MRRTYYLRFVLMACLVICGTEALSLLLGFIPIGQEGLTLGFVSLVILPAVAIMYGSMRVSRFHPALMKEYRQWLTSTPYSPGKELPFGSPTPRWPDLIPIAFAGLAFAVQLQHFEKPMHEAASGYDSIPLVAAWSIAGTTGLCCLGYAIPSIAVLYITDGAWRIFTIAAILLAAVHEAAAPWLPFIASLNNAKNFPGTVFVAGMAIVFAFCWAGIAGGLRNFPWEGRFGTRDTFSDRFLRTTQISLIKATRNSATGSVKPNELGYPLGMMKVVDARAEFPDSTRWMIVGLMAWTILIFGDIASKSDPQATRDVLAATLHLYLAGGIFALFAGGVRLAVYTASCSPPISIWGRIATGRLIIPGYDRVYTASLAIATMGLIGPYAIPRIPLPLAPMIALFFGGMLAIALFAPPSLKRWKLTGVSRQRVPLSVRQSSSLYAKMNA